MERGCVCKLQLHEESGIMIFRRGWRRCDIYAGRLGCEVGVGPGIIRKFVVTKVPQARFGLFRLPEPHRGWQIIMINFHANRTIRFEGIGKLWQRDILGDSHVPGYQHSHRIPGIIQFHFRVKPAHAVAHIRYITEMRFPFKFVVIHFRCIRHEELVTSSVQHELGHGVSALLRVFKGVNVIYQRNRFIRQFTSFN